jgi:hypothetical protein
MPTIQDLSPDAKAVFDKLNLLPHTDFSVLRQVVDTTPALGLKKPNFLQEADGSWSSKRLQSFFAFGLAAVIVAFQVWHNLNLVDPSKPVDFSIAIGSFLGYGAACQGMTLVK